MTGGLRSAGIACLPSLVAAVVAFLVGESVEDESSTRLGMLWGAAIAAPIAICTGLVGRCCVRESMMAALTCNVVAFLLRLLAIGMVFAVVVAVARPLLVPLLLTATACLVVACILDAAFLARALMQRERKGA